MRTLFSEAVLKRLAAGKNPARFCLVVLCAIIAFLVGCATEVGNHTLLKQGYAPKPADFPVEVFTNGVPTRPFERVAILDAHCESQGFMVPNLQNDGLPVLIKQARQSGCDAIIEIEERRPANWTLETRTLHFTAVGIAYR